ncbi:MAG: PTS fructose transporter subunit IIA [Gammaproteobacteria bacterium]|nr:PTS fructose transporter subunit IIA [Gammaproteobacteria bacterium]
MSVALLLVSHKGIASNLLNTAASIVNDKPVNMAYVEVPMDAPIDTMRQDIQKKLDQFDQNKDVLILTDIYGGTPSNLASCFISNTNTRLVSGLNLAMIIKAINYRSLPLTELVEKIILGGRQSIAQHVDEHPSCQ